jgi:Na+/melibiose symporter-like transporter
MDKWKKLTVGRKRFWIAVGVMVVIAVLGWFTGWWSSPPVV